mgnify:CR=1 FL=1
MDNIKCKLDITVVILVLVCNAAHINPFALCTNYIKTFYFQLEPLPALNSKIIFASLLPLST